MKTATTPFPLLLKWAGSKWREAPQILAALLRRRCVGRVCEPFAGSAAFSGYLASLGERYPPGPILVDANPCLMKLYEAVRDRPLALLDVFSTMIVGQDRKFSREIYRRAREHWLYDSRIEVVGAAMLFVNRTNYNGLWRTNQSGRYNVPPGKAEGADLSSMHAQILEAVPFWSLVLDGATLHTGDYTLGLNSPHSPPILFIDPPYEGTFVDYAKQAGRVGASALHDKCQHAARRGSLVLATLPDIEALIEPWLDWCDVEPLERVCQMGARTAGKTALLRQVLLVSK